MSKGAKIFIFTVFSFFIVAFAIAFFSLNASPISILRNNEESSGLENVDKEGVVDNKTQKTVTSDTTKEVVVTKTPEVTPPANVEMSNYKTTIYDKEKNRIHNITLAVSKLNGAIVKPDEEFSFNKTIGPMGANQGYKKATGFNGSGKKIKVYAGGMCQLSSTLYNAVLDAGLPVTERHPHSRRVYYVPKNKDASVSYGSADLKFKNTTDKDLLISSTTDGHTVNIKIEKIG